MNAKVKIKQNEDFRIINLNEFFKSYKKVDLAEKEILPRLIDSARTELNANATEFIEIIDEIVFVNHEKTNLTWEKLIWRTYFNRINLSAHAFYATPNIHFDRKTNKGKPFAYHVYGTAFTIAKIDVLRGISEIESVQIVHDFGKSINPEIDLGQVEGALLQGIGWVTMEELQYSENGKLLANSLSTYKIPDIYSSPKKTEVVFLDNSENRFGPLSSKAIGEPPFMYGIGAFFAIKNAIENAKQEKTEINSSPITNEKILLELYKERK